MNDADPPSRLEAFRTWWWAWPHKKRIAWWLFGTMIVAGIAATICGNAIQHYGTHTPDPASGRIYRVSLGRGGTHYTTQLPAQVMELTTDVIFFVFAIMIVLAIAAKLLGLKTPPST